MSITHFSQRMEEICARLGLPVTDEYRRAWAETEQHHVDIRFREMTKETND